MSYQGTNSSGSSYTCYEGGKGYTYSNQNGSSYYNTGSGHGFYKLVTLKFNSSYATFKMHLSQQPWRIPGFRRPGLFHALQLQPGDQQHHLQEMKMFGWSERSWSHKFSHFLIIFMWLLITNIFVMYIIALFLILI